MKKNIWILNHYAGLMYFDEGGRHYSFAKYLRRAGYNPVVFCSNSKHGGNQCFFDNDELINIQNKTNIDVPFVFVKGRPYSGNGKSRVLNMLDFYFNVQKAARQYMSNHERPDVIYASSVHPLTLLAGIHLARKNKVKCVCEIRDLWPESLVAFQVLKRNSLIVWGLRLFEKWIYRKADAIIFTMEGAYDYIKERNWERTVPKSKTHYINNGVDLEQYDYNKENCFLEDEDIHNDNIIKVVYAGSIRRVNNLSLIIETAKHVKNSSVKFLIWGGGDELDHLRDVVKREGLTNIVFKGRVDKKYIPYVTSNADINLIHGEESGILRFGMSENKIFDSLAAGKPILVDFKSKYNPVIDNGAGVETVNNTPVEIAKSIDAMCDISEYKLNEMRNSEKETAKKYDFSFLTGKLIDVIEGI